MCVYSLNVNENSDKRPGGLIGESKTVKVGCYTLARLRNSTRKTRLRDHICCIFYL